MKTCPNCNGNRKEFQPIVGPHTVEDNCFVCGGKGEIMTKAEMAEQALAVQDACNGVPLSALMHKISRLMMQAYDMGTTGAMRCAPVRLILCQIMHLSTGQLMDSEIYSKAYDECQQMVEGDE